MTPDVIAILGVGIALAGLILATVVPGFRELRGEIRSLQDRMNRFEGEIRDRMSRFEERTTERLTALETRMTDLERRFEKCMANLDRRFLQLEAEVRERIAHLEGLTEGFIREQREQKEDAPQL